MTEPPSASVRRRRLRLTRRRIVKAVLVLVLLLLTRFLTFPAQATLNPIPSHEDLSARFGDVVQDETVLAGNPNNTIWQRTDFFADSTRRIRALDPKRPGVLVDIDTNTFASTAGARIAYKLYTPTRPGYGGDHEQPLGARHSGSSAPYPGTAVQGVECTREGSSACDRWIFWQLDGKVIRETVFTNNNEYVYYDEVLSAFKWMSGY